MAAEEVTAERKTNVDSTKNLEELKTMWVLTPFNQIKYNISNEQYFYLWKITLKFLRRHGLHMYKLTRPSQRPFKNNFL